MLGLQSVASIILKGNAMKIASIVLALSLCAAFFAGCSTQPAPRLVYKQSQFESRLEYLRFCQNNELQTRRCE
jgi:hypothetical protein